MDLFVKNGIRPTSFRKEVLDIFIGEEHALTVQQIEEALGEHDRITLYRTLRTFIDQSLIHEIVMPGNIKKYALCQDCQVNHNHGKHVHHHEHIHFHCKSCDEVFCVDTDIPKIQLGKFEIASLEIQAHGFCSSCAAKS